MNMGGSSTRNPWMLLASTAMALIHGVDAQIGVSLCACQPAYYQFTLDFSLTCKDMNVAGPGIVDTACVLNTQGNQNVTDFTPVLISQIQVLELDQNLQVVYQTTYSESFVNGDIFNYTSITQTQTSSLNATSLPRGFQMFLTGRNKEEQDLVNFYAIVYDNACGLFPLLQVGMQAGWTIFSNLGPPPKSLCPAVPASPTALPATGAPTTAPTVPGSTAVPMTRAPSPPPATAAPSIPAATIAPTPCPTFRHGKRHLSLVRPTECPQLPPTAPPVPAVTKRPTPMPVPVLPLCPPTHMGKRRHLSLAMNTPSPTACIEPGKPTVMPESGLTTTSPPYMIAPAGPSKAKGGPSPKAPLPPPSSPAPPPSPPKASKATKKKAESPSKAMAKLSVKAKGGPPAKAKGPSKAPPPPPLMKKTTKSGRLPEMPSKGGSLMPPSKAGPSPSKAGPPSKLPPSSPAPPCPPTHMGKRGLSLTHTSAPTSCIEPGMPSPKVPTPMPPPSSKAGPSPMPPPGSKAGPSPMPPPSSKAGPSPMPPPSSKAGPSPMPPPSGKAGPSPMPPPSSKSGPSSKAGPSPMPPPSSNAGPSPSPPSPTYMHGKRRSLQ